MQSESETKNNNLLEMRTVQGANDQNLVQKQSDINAKKTQKYIKQFVKEPIAQMNKNSQTSKSRQILTARQMQKLAK